MQARLWHWAVPVAALHHFVQGVAREPRETSFLSSDATDFKNRPVSKVTTLLKDMLKQMENEAAEDEDVYDKMACWCETNDKEKTQAIKHAEDRVAELGAKTAELAAGSSRLTTESDNLKKEISANQAALDKATAIRQKEQAEFNAEERDLVESISALKAAITVLSKHHSMLQVPRSHLLGVATTLEHEMTKHNGLLKGVLTPKTRKMIGVFVQSPEDFISGPQYQPQAGEIFGILKQMKETFESNLESSQKEEMKNSKAYDELKSAKQEEIKAGQALSDSKGQDLAITDEKYAIAKQDAIDTNKALSSDAQFLTTLKDKCAQNDKAWEQRQKTRQLEMEACSKALALLSSDDAHGLFAKMFNPSFLQKRSSADSHRRTVASRILKAIAGKLHKPELAALAAKVELDAFTRVKKSIDEMVVQLQKQKVDEVKLKDFCIKEINSNELQTEQRIREKSNLAAKITDLEMTIKRSVEEITELQREVAEFQKELKRAGEDRVNENKAFQTTIADQRATQKLLAQALTILRSAYGNKAKAALTQAAKVVNQHQESKKEPPPAGFATLQTSPAAGGVLAMIEEIITEAKRMEAEAVRDEEKDQKTYEEYLRSTNESVKEKSKDIMHKSKQKAKNEISLVRATEDKEAVLLQIDQLLNYRAELKGRCDFVLKNFDVRQAARNEEIEALTQAKAILGGAKFSFVQDVEDGAVQRRNIPLVEWHLKADGTYKASPSNGAKLRVDANGVFGCDSCDCSFIDRMGKTTNCNIERNSRAAVFKWLPANSTVVEVGARYGTTSCSIADKQKQSGRVVSFEADHLVWDDLEKNRISHGCNFRTARGLLGKEDGKIIENHYGTLAANGAAIAKRGVDPKTLKVVPHFTLQDIQTKHHLKFDVGVFDCEGCFTFVMRDFPELASQLNLMIVESHDPEEESTVQHLLKNGWVLKDSFGRQRVITRK